MTYGSMPSLRRSKLHVRLRTLLACIPPRLARNRSRHPSVASFYHLA